MMDATQSVIVFVVGLISGICLAWLFLRSKIGDALQRTDISNRSERALLNERLQESEKLIATLEERLKSADTKIENLQESLRTNGEQRSAAEAKSARIPQLEGDIKELQGRNIQLESEVSQLKTRIESQIAEARDKLEWMTDANKKLTDSFKALSADALDRNNKTFLNLANEGMAKFMVGAKGDLEARQKAIHELVAPVKESLDKVDHKMLDLEKARIGAYSELIERVRSLTFTQKELKEETSRLVGALRKPSVRGRWGEIQLRRVVEIADMLPYCDFEEQVSVDTDEGRSRPDLIVKLPGGKSIIVDSKAPLEAYLNALDATDEESKKSHMQKHAEQIRKHMADLSSKAYWSKFSPAPEFVVMFLPGEAFFSAGLESDPHLIETGVNNGVIIASPTTLIALLHAVAYGWKQENVARSAREINALGRQIHDRLSVLADHFDKMGRGLTGAVQAYNSAIGSLERRILVTARKFVGLGVSSNKQIMQPESLETMPHQLKPFEVVDSEPREDDDEDIREEKSERG